MKSLEQLLGASARFALLRAMYYQTGPVSLRQWARLADVHPHSAELVVKDLLKEHLISREQDGSRTWFSRNPDHPSWHIIANVCEGADQAWRRVQRPALNKRAKRVMAFMDESRKMLMRARRHVHVA